MAKKQVLISICDRCHTEVESPFEKRRIIHKERYVLPPGWLHVQGDTATHTVFEMDLCEDCKVIVLEAAGSARRS